MSLSLISKMRQLALTLLFVGAIVGGAAAQPPVETYTDDAVPNVPLPQYDRYNSPMKAGQMTLQDVLQTHAKPSDQPLLPPVATPRTAAQAPALAPATQPSSTNLMLMQGMKSVFQQSGSDKPTANKLKVPQLQPDGSIATAVPAVATPVAPAAAPAVPTPVDAPVAAGVKFQPGQEPKNLAGTNSAFAAPTATAAPVAASPARATAVSESSAPIAKTKSATMVATPGCEPHIENWTKSCADAGYPDNFVGKITGETRTVCPDKSLQDVWIANSCAAPDDVAEGTSTIQPPPAATDASGEMVQTKPARATAKPEQKADLAVAASPAQSSTSRRTDASCGAANGLAANSMPTSDLCTFGIPSDVSGEGPWRWNCKGISGGMTVSCAATVVAAPAAAQPAAHTAKAASAGPDVEDGICGSSDGAGMDHAPGTGLCAKGVASRVNGSGPWTWACSGQNGGQAAACTASRKVDGQCGIAGKTGADQMPTMDLCTAGLASAVTGDGPWNWTCSGLYGGNPVTCSAAPKKDAICGSASLTGHRDMPKDSLCSVGQAGSVHGNGPWNWSCNGANGGAPVSCTAPVSINGVCGNTNGVAAARAPTEELCMHGTATRVTGSGPWSWNCSGVDGGDTQSCTAPLVSHQQQQAAEAPVVSPPPVLTPAAPTAPSAPASVTNDKQANLCGSASELMALEAPDKDLCVSGRASDLNGNGPWTWTCDDGLHSSNCSTLSPLGSFNDVAAKTKSAGKAAKSVPALAAPAPVPAVEEKIATCGFAAGQGTSQVPSDGLCSIGKASSVKGSGPWHWTCVKDKTKSVCEAPKLVDATCGIANGSVQKTMPAKGLCNEGTPTEVQGNGPWLWTCVGAGGGSSISCSAAAQSQTRVDGSCGLAVNTPATTLPDANLCDSGIQSTVYGNGPWTWTCSGLNGGIAATCSVQKNTPQAPPPPGPPVNGLCGNSNGVAMVAEPVEDLCTGGTATSISGNGPWNWNCLGSNGGMTVSCTAPLQPPAPITGVCGSANGVPTLTTPRSGLCSAGISSAVSGSGPWTWSCSGTNGGGAVGCVAPLAGTDVGSLPSLSSTPAAGEAPSPQAAPLPSVTSSGLVTPHLQSGSMPSVKRGSMRDVPAPSFAAPPQPSYMPPPPDFANNGMEAPITAPDLPDDASPLQPPPIRDTLAPTPALKPPVIDVEGNVIPGNHFVLPEDVSTLSFSRSSENINEDALPTLDKLAAVLQANSGVRVTLTAYADNSSGISPREARRLSLSRALAVRDYLTTKGISSGRIDVRALGANVPTSSGDADRVDIKAN